MKNAFKSIPLAEFNPQVKNAIRVENFDSSKVKFVPRASVPKVIQKPNNFFIEYNIRNVGVRFTSEGNAPVLLYLHNKVNNENLAVQWHYQQPNTFFETIRQWHTNWVIEAFEFHEGELLKVYSNEFNPYGKTVHFYLDPSMPIKDHIEYVEACHDYISHWKSDNHAIESIHSDTIKNLFPDLNIVNLIGDEGCYVNYEIGPSNSTEGTYEKYKMVYINEEFMYYSYHQPVPHEGLTPYELAKNIIFGPDYNKLYKLFPYEWILQK